MKKSNSIQQMQESAWVNLKIRKASIADATQIHSIAQDLKLDKTEPQKNGFLIYTTDLDGYKKRISSTNYFYVAERDGEIIGYLFCFDDKTIKSLVEKKILFGEDKTFPFFFSKKKPFILADQMGIMKKYSYQGIGQALFDKFFSDVIGSKCDIYAEILHKPIKNNASSSFCKSIGFSEITEITNSDGNTWGIYHIPSEI